MIMEGDDDRRIKKRKRGVFMKLQRDQSVEVRSEEEGFLGSWHSGRVIHCAKRRRHVRYDNVLNDKGSGYLVDVVRVSKALDGDSEFSCWHERGLIRPKPPFVKLERQKIKFGLCVDVNYQDAWWEGVIFDHCHGMERRSVFFPDLGDEMEVVVSRMRITQDWDEVTEEWKCRKSWVFLELVEKYERESFLVVSAKQIWYDIREKKEFRKIGEWTNNVKDLWENMITEVVNDYLSLTKMEAFSVLKLPGSLLNETPNAGLSVEQPLADVDSLSMALADNEIVVPKEPVALVADISPEFQNEIPYNDVDQVVTGASCFGKNKKRRISTCLKSKCWKTWAIFGAQLCPDAVKKYLLASTAEARTHWLEKLRKHLVYLGWKIEWLNENNIKRYRYKSPDEEGCKTYMSLREVCRAMEKDSNMNSLQSRNDQKVDHYPSDLLLNPSGKIQDLDIVSPSMTIIRNVEPSRDGVTASRSTTNQKQKFLRNSKGSLCNLQNNGLPLRVLRSRKRVQNVHDHSLLHNKPLNVLSWLIDTNMVLPRSKVYYKAKRRHCRKAKAEGRITREGIKCNCCKKIYSLLGFEIHASDSHTRRPSRSIFLEDGRISLTVTGFVHHVDAGFVAKAILREMRVVISLLAVSVNINVDHVSCLKIRAADISRNTKNWFCGKDCEKIYYSLHKLLGEPVSVGVDKLTWTLVKFIDSERCALGRITSELLAESYTRLNLALSVMHECFEPFKEPFSSRDLLEDVMFSRWSELNRLNFKGFYTVLLEKNEELVSVATVRVYGKTVAELPLVGTRLQYRRHGMCHLLINELEKKLRQLGVERLVLPAVPSVLETWTGSFGFAKMTNYERSQFLDYTFLDFQDTIMCHKLLAMNPSPGSVFLTETQQKCDAFSGNCSVNFNKLSSVSKICQVKGINEGEKLGQQMGDTFAGNNVDHPSGATNLVKMVQKPNHGDQQRQNGAGSQYDFVKQDVGYNGPYKCYMRRKKRKALELSS
ncbi:hypothetical protein RJT34_12601 [Clitoria ternatea]|uniref:N-acetyltransferase domain-containing protein n=1 Tax=Clitoria ternatea TaxID=43366 RepID=A0AAN9PL25_CLITE